VGSYSSTTMTITAAIDCDDGGRKGNNLLIENGIKI
jgi:hypothetical protein